MFRLSIAMSVLVIGSKGIERPILSACTDCEGRLCLYRSAETSKEGKDSKGRLKATWDEAFGYLVDEEQYSFTPAAHVMTKSDRGKLFMTPVVIEGVKRNTKIAWMITHPQVVYTLDDHLAGYNVDDRSAFELTLDGTENWLALRRYRGGVMKLPDSVEKRTNLITVRPMLFHSSQVEETLSDSKSERGY